jgi:hypothetical protein
VGDRARVDAGEMALQDDLAPQRGRVQSHEGPVLGLQASHLCLQHSDLVPEPRQLLARRRLRVRRQGDDEHERGGTGSSEKARSAHRLIYTATSPKVPI